MSGGDFTDLLRSRIASQGWWVLFSLGGAGRKLLCDIEGKHYAGRRNKFFDALVATTLYGPAAVFFARKKEMSAKQLSQHLDDVELFQQAETVAQGTADVLVLAPSAELAALGSRLVLLLLGEEES
jgi:hypothetical protein